MENNDRRFVVIDHCNGQKYLDEVVAKARRRKSKIAPEDTSSARFTHDWLIRFCELHPFDPETADYYKNDDEFNSLIYTSHVAISPFFMAIIYKHVPYLHIIMYFQFTDEFALEFKKPSKKITVLMGQIRFSNVSPGTISSFRKRNMYFDSNFIVCEDVSVITPDELKEIIACTKILAIVRTETTVPVKMTELWPTLRRNYRVIFQVDNVDYNEPAFYEEPFPLIELPPPEPPSAVVTRTVHNVYSWFTVWSMFINFVNMFFRRIFRK